MQQLGGLRWRCTEVHPSQCSSCEQSTQQQACSVSAELVIAGHGRVCTADQQLHSSYSCCGRCACWRCGQQFLAMHSNPELSADSCYGSAANTGRAACRSRDAAALHLSWSVPSTTVLLGNSSRSQPPVAGMA